MEGLPKQEHIEKIYRGIWASQLEDGQELPVGGSIFSTELTTKLKLDFDFFEGELKNANKDFMIKQYEEKGADIRKWLEDIGSDVDPFIFATLMAVQKKMENLLKVNTDEEKENPLNQERSRIYSGGTVPDLSELVGRSACAERAAFAQFLLQRVGISSSYVSGISMVEAKDEDAFPEDHSFVVIEHEGNNYIYDVARPRSENRLPRILKPVVPFDLETFKDKDDLLIKAKEVLQGGELYFGVGTPTAGQRSVVE